MRRLIGICLVVVMAVALIVVSLVLFLGASERGTRLLAGQAERFLPLRIVDISGTLWGELRAGGVSLDLESARLEIHGLVLAVRAWPLVFDGELHLDRAGADAVIYTPIGAPAESARPARLELPALPLNVRVDQLHLGTLQLADLEFSDVSGSALWTAERLTIGYLDFTLSGVSVALSGRLDHGVDPLLRAEFLWSYPEAAIEGSGSLVGVTSRLQLAHRLEGDYRADVRGFLDLSTPAQPGLDLAVTAEPLTLGDLEIDELQGTVAGTLAGLRVAAEARLDVAPLAPFPVSVRLDGPVAGPVELTLAGEPLAGLVRGSGQLAWREGLDLGLTGRADDLDLSPLAAQLEGHASANVDLAYREGRLQIGVSDIAGSLNEHEVEGAFQLAQTDRGWRLAPVELRVGENRVAGELELAPEGLSVVAEVVAPDLDALGIGVAGDLSASVSASGKWPALAGRVAFNSGGLAGFDVTATGISGTATMAEGRLDGTVAAEQIASAGLVLAQLSADVRGHVDALDWALGWRDGRVAGRYAREGEKHRISAVSIDVHALEQNWSTREPVTLIYDQGSIDLSGFCLVGQPSEACLARLTYNQGSISTAGRVKQLPLGFAAPWLRLPVRDDGFVEGEWRIEGAPGRWQGNLKLAARSLFLLLPDVEEAAIELPDLTVDGTLNGTDLTMDAAAVAPGFSVTGSASVTPAGPEGQLDGRVELIVTDLSVLRAFDYRIESLGGELRGGLDLTGGLLAPRFEGLVEIVDAELQLKDPDLALEDLDAALTIDDSGTFGFRATGSSDGAQLSAQATGSGLFDGDVSLQGSLVGRELQARHPDWEVSVSPDLRVDYADGAGRISGRVEIPSANVRINTLPTSMPRPSDDVVVLGREERARGPVGSMIVDVELVLGDDVSLAAAGVVANLQGTLRARLDERGRTRVRGKLDVSGGIVSAQGQTLTLESGSIVYNGPINNPYLDIRAVRIIDDRAPPIKVGLHIRGTANNLITSVFSEPPMSDSRALSFLVLGRDLEEGSSGDSNQVLAAAINLGLSRADSITSEIKRFTGLDELSAMAETQNSFAIVAGKRVTEDIYVRYTYDTLTAMSALLVRYSLTDRWHLEARSSEYSSMDLMYSFEQ